MSRKLPLNIPTPNYRYAQNKLVVPSFGFHKPINFKNRLDESIQNRVDSILAYLPGRRFQGKVGDHHNLLK